MKSFILLSIILIAVMAGCNNQISLKSSDSIIASGQMPAIIKDNSDKVHLVYGSGDSIMYSLSSDHGNTFSSPSLISILPKLAASHTRGPQVAATSDGLIVTACNDMGNIFSYKMESSGKWYQSSRVNDLDTVAKENLMALAADGENAFAVWLDLRDKHNKIFGAQSIDGGKTWNKNIMIYASPDTTVCECCKPSVAIRGNNVYVMFRNWLDEKRDMYLIESSNGGTSFGEVKKLGTGSWALDACPMDGGSLAINNNNIPQTIWRRKGKIYSCEPGKAEVEIGEGRGCTMESVNSKNVYAWTENGEVIVRKPQGMKKNLGKGQLPIIKAINNEHIICVWENEKKIHRAVIEL
jgi:hypothetical protein